MDKTELNIVTKFHFEYLVELVGIDNAMKYYEIKERTVDPNFVDASGKSNWQVELAAFVLKNDQR